MKKYSLADVSIMTDEQLSDFCGGGDSRNYPGTACHYCLIGIEDEDADFDEIYVENLLDGEIDENGNDDWADADKMFEEVRDIARNAEGEIK